LLGKIGTRGLKSEVWRDTGAGRQRGAGIELGETAVHL